MAYKDADKQREAVRQATQRYRQRLKAVADRECGITKVSQGVTDVIPATPKAVIPNEPEPQSHTPMMVGYVSPQD